MHFTFLTAIKRCRFQTENIESNQRESDNSQMAPPYATINREITTLGALLATQHTNLQVCNNTRQTII
jgi:hypothetical protein